MNHQGLATKRLHRIVALKALATCLDFCLTCLPKIFYSKRGFTLSVNTDF
jgi:hypothetical protein